MCYTREYIIEEIFCTNIELRIRIRFKPDNWAKISVLYRGFQSFHNIYLDRIPLIRNNEAVAGQERTSIARMRLKRAFRREEYYARNTRHRRVARKGQDDRQIFRE